jgi:hypothetical protein
MTTVLAVHPAPMTYLPARKRIEQSGFLAMRTPVSIRRASRDGFEPVQVPDSMTGVPKDGLLRDADGLWKPMTRLVGGTLEYNVTTDHLGWYLQGETGRADLSYVFSRTPVAGHVPLRRGANAVMATAHRGLPLEVDNAKRITVDGRALAAEGVALHMDRNVRILTGGGQAERAYVRFVPALALFDPFGNGDGIWRLLYETNQSAARGMVCQPSDVAAMLALANDLGIGDGNAGVIEEVADALGPGDWYEDVRAKVVNAYAATAAGILERSMMTIRDGDERRLRLDPLLRRVGTLRLQAEVGLAHAGDARSAVATMIEAIEASGKADDRAGEPYVLATALRRMHLDPMPAPHLDDVEALVRLAPNR